MTLQIGAYRYHVLPSEQELHLQGRPVLAICEHRERRLLVRSAISPGLFAKVMGEAAELIWRYRYADRGEEPSREPVVGDQVTSED